MYQPQVAQLVRFVLPLLPHRHHSRLDAFPVPSLAWPFVGAQLIARTGPHHEKVALVVKAIWHEPRTATTGAADGPLHL